MRFKKNRGSFQKNVLKFYRGGQWGYTGILCTDGYFGSAAAQQKASSIYCFRFFIA